jgi:hypothetical protein
VKRKQERRGKGRLRKGRNGEKSGQDVDCLGGERTEVLIGGVAFGTVFPRRMGLREDMWGYWEKGMCGCSTVKFLSFPVLGQERKTNGE